MNRNAIQMNKLPKPIIRLIASYGVLPEISQLNQCCYKATRLLLCKQNIKKYLYDFDAMTALLTPRNILSTPERVMLLAHYALNPPYKFMHLIIKLSPSIKITRELLALLLYAKLYHASDEFTDEIRRYGYDENTYNHIAANTKINDAVIIPINKQYSLAYVVEYFIILNHYHKLQITPEFNPYKTNSAALSMLRQINPNQYHIFSSTIIGRNSHIIDETAKIYMNDRNPSLIKYNNDPHRFKKLLHFDNGETAIDEFCNIIPLITNPKCIRMYLNIIPDDEEIREHDNIIEFDHISAEMIHTYVNILNHDNEYHHFVALSLLSYIKQSGKYIYYTQTLANKCADIVYYSFNDFARDKILDIKDVPFITEILGSNYIYSTMLFSKYANDIDATKTIFKLYLPHIIYNPNKYEYCSHHIKILGNDTIKDIIMSSAFSQKHISTALALFNVT